jgi:signal transduction histidine kinase
MRVTAFLRSHRVEVAWALFAAANLAAMGLWPDWETIPFHFVWISLTITYGFRVWRNETTFGVLGAVAAGTGALIFVDAFEGIQLWGELFEVPLMSAMFLAMVWHARRRQDALRTAERRAEENAALLEQQERFLHDASHELRTPVTIARGHLELALRANGRASAEIDVALDELDRMDRIVERMLLLAKAELPTFIVRGEIDVVPFLEDVFVRWSGVAPRVWRLGRVDQGVLLADSEGLRIALDALLENAVEHTDPNDVIELRAHGENGSLQIDVADQGKGIDPGAAQRVFERFARADPARARTSGGVGLGLAIVRAIVDGHGGQATVATGPEGSTFTLSLPSFGPAVEGEPVSADGSLAPPLAAG